MKAPLTSEENQILKEILNAVIGMGRMTEIALLNARQKDALPILRNKVLRGDDQEKIYRYSAARIVKLGHEKLTKTGRCL